MFLQGRKKGLFKGDSGMKTKREREREKKKNRNSKENRKQQKKNP